MPPPKGPKLTFISAEETVVDVEFSPSSSVSSYDLCYKVYQQDWEHQVVKTIGEEELKGGKVKTNIGNLEPGTTYSFRLVAKDGSGNSGPPGPELIVDTEAVGCTPKSSMCIVL